MIFYFSGTGNNRWIAKKLASYLNDEVYDIMQVDIQTIQLKQNGTLGFVFPIYAWGVPKVMKDFIKHFTQIVKIPNQTFCFSIGGCGEDVGNAFKQLEPYLKLDSQYSISMPNNYVIGSNLDKDEIVSNKIKKAEEKIKTIAEQISVRQSVIDINKGSLPAIKTRMIAPMMARFAANMGKNFYSDDKCIGCGLCVKYCQFANIEMVDGKPKWHDHCHLCLACINRCPQQAIQYGKQTSKRTRYYLEDK